MREPRQRQIELKCPAKINLRLSVVGRRPDGYHDLIAFNTRVSLADTLSVEWDPDLTEDVFSVCGRDVPVNRDNLVLRALDAFRAVCPVPGSYQIQLEKQIPVGAGLGGGSSDAAGMLKALQALWGNPVDDADLKELAGKLGADVPYFLYLGCGIVRGIGERFETKEDWASSLREFRLALFKPWVGVSTPWAYRELARHNTYEPGETEEVFLSGFSSRGFPWLEFPHNSFRRVVDLRFPTIPVLLKQLNSLPGVRAEMTGSGSACFALFQDDMQIELIRSNVVKAWGSDCFFEVCSFL